jgi:hypothetical protein
VKTTYVEIININGKTSTLELNYRVQNIDKETINNMYELEVAMENKMYLKTYYNHQPKSVTMDETLAKSKHRNCK